MTMKVDMHQTPFESIQMFPDEDWLQNLMNRFNQGFHDTIQHNLNRFRHGKGKFDAVNIWIDSRKSELINMNRFNRFTWIDSRKSESIQTPRKRILWPTHKRIPMHNNTHDTKNHMTQWGMVW